MGGMDGTADDQARRSLATVRVGELCSGTVAEVTRFHGVAATPDRFPAHRVGEVEPEVGSLDLSWRQRRPDDARGVHRRCVRTESGPCGPGGVRRMRYVPPGTWVRYDRPETTTASRATPVSTLTMSRAVGVPGGRPSTMTLSPVTGHAPRRRCAPIRADRRRGAAATHRNKRGRRSRRPPRGYRRVRWFATPCRPTSTAVCDRW